ncbi:MAG: hypothetical protein L0H70_06970 [Xanthomonadales bacterium]|nr:hypothetical protein [Xanthomonadales bacterium]
MSSLRQALRARRVQQQRVRMERQRASMAVATLRALYRAHPLPPLVLAAGIGTGLGWHENTWRPPMVWLYPGLRWGLMMARGWLG